MLYTFFSVDVTWRDRTASYQTHEWSMKWLYTCKPYLPVSRHLRAHGHAQANHKNLTITIIDHNDGWSRTYRLARERFYLEGINDKNKKTKKNRLSHSFFLLSLGLGVTQASILDSSFKEFIPPPEHQYWKKFSSRVFSIGNLYNDQD